jgi:hypothetical protein
VLVGPPGAPNGLATAAYDRVTGTPSVRGGAGKLRILEVATG